MHSVCTFVGALVSLGNMITIAWYALLYRRRVSNRRTVRSQPLHARGRASILVWDEATT